MQKESRSCHYHQDRAAQFYCEECATSYCPDCVTWRKNTSFVKEYFYMCPRCNKETKTLGVSHLITPFWKNFPLFFTYPFSKYPLIMLALYAVPITFVETFLAANLFAPFLAFLIFTFILLLYCNDIFQATVSGNFRPPRTSVDLDESVWLVFKQFLLLILLIMVMRLLPETPLSDAAAAVVFEFIKIPVPAMLMLLLVNSSLASSLNPLKIVVLISRVGWRYLLVYGFCTVLVLAPSFLLYLFSFIQLDHMFIGRLFYYAGLAYFFIIFYFFLGYIALQYHEKLGLEIEFTAYSRLNNRELLEKKEQTDPLLNDANLLVRDGKHARALELIRTQSKGEITNPDLGVLYLKLLNQLDENERLEYSGPLLIELFVAKGRVLEAANLYQKCINLFPKFSIKPEPALRLYQWYLAKKEFMAAVRCGENFVTQAPVDPRAPEVHLKIAGISITKLGDKRRAFNLLKGFRESYPGHEKQKDAEKILNWLKQSGKKGVRTGARKSEK